MQCCFAVSCARAQGRDRSASPGQRFKASDSAGGDGGDGDGGAAAEEGTAAAARGLLDALLARHRLPKADKRDLEVKQASGIEQVGSNQSGRANGGLSPWSYASPPRALCLQ